MVNNHINKKAVFDREDRDLLVELKVEVKNIRADIKELKDQTTNRIETLEREKADRKELDELQNKVNKDIEVRVRSLENWKMWVVGYSAAASVIVSVLFKGLLK